MRKPTKTSLTRKLDKLVSEVVRKQGFCCWCKSTQNLQACHIFSRRYRSVRWDIETPNVICLCARHHFYSHSNPILFAEFVKDYLGKHKYNELKIKSQSVHKWTIPEMEELLETLRAG